MARRKKSDDLNMDGLPEESGPVLDAAAAPDVVASPKIESPELAPAQFEAHPVSHTPHLVAHRDTMELPPLEAPAVDEPRVDAVTPPPSRFARAARFSPLAATIALAAALGAMAGSLTTAGVVHFASVTDAAPAAAAPDVAASGQMKDSLARLDADIAAVRAGLEQSGKTHTTQFAKIAERLDRAEKNRAETPAKLEKITETLDRLEKRAAAPVAAASDITGTVSPARPAAVAALAEAKLPAVDGWVLRDVYNGAAMIQGKRYGILEVVPGDNVPGAGRVEAIRRVDGRWVVTTSKGVIVAR